MNLVSDNKASMATQPIGVELSLSSPTVMMGEPLVLFCTVTNASPEIIATYMGINLEGWLTYRLVDAAGQAVADLPDPRTKNPGGIHVDGPRISPRGHFQSHVVLSQRFALTHAGQYSLTVQVYLPYAPDERDNSIWPEHFEAIYGTVFRAERTFPVLVTEADPGRLRSLAEALANQFVQGLPYNDTILIESLFSIPEEYALPSWKKGAYASGLSHIGALQDTARELTRLNSFAAADILADMIWKPAQTSAEAWSRLSWISLHNMYFTAGPELKQHIQALFQEHNQALLEAPILITD